MGPFERRLTRTLSEGLSGRQPATLRVVREGFELVLQGDVQSLMESLDEISSLVEALSERLSPSKQDNSMPTAQELSAVQMSDIPSIKPSKSTAENIASLFNAAWGRQPRSLAEVVKALEVNAVPDRPENVSVYLNRLVRKGYMRRIKKDGKWAYFRVPEE